MGELIVKTTQGLIEGKEEQGVKVFKAVPYAQPPVGALRFAPPQPKQPWAGVRYCKDYSPKAFQPDMSKAPLYGREFYYGEDVSMSEDCLYLNVWAPLDAKWGDNLPVMVWIHGGGFDHGYGSEVEFRGHSLAKKGAIVVTINYRVGALGFFAHPDLDKENPDIPSGNQGIYDQLAALKWVHENISAFGGDPDKITLAGQSAGCISVQMLISSPQTQGLVSRAILQSAGGIPGFPISADRSEIIKFSQLLMNKLGARSIDEMRTLSAENIAYSALELAGEIGGMIWRPSVDGHLISEQMGVLASNGQILNIPYIIGSTADEMGGATPQTMGASALGFATAMAQMPHRQPVYLYKFCRPLPGDDAGAFHSAELWYEFGTLDACWRPMTQADYALSEEMQGYWINFMSTGNPNGAGLPIWPACHDESDMHIFDVK